MRIDFRKLGLRVLVIVIIASGVIFSLPSILTFTIRHKQTQTFQAMSEQFPVTVNPREKVIIEDVLVNAFLESNHSPFQAAVGNAMNAFETVFIWITVAISDASWYQSVASVSVGNDRLVSITPGMRKEQVALVFSKALAWNSAQKKEFLMASSPSDPSSRLLEGSFAPGVYSLSIGTPPAAARALIDKRFATNILSRYGPKTAEVVPLTQALTIASLIEREAGGAEDMRLISGIIWNRLFINMKLQIDATLQYAKVNTAATSSWWPRIVPADRYRASPYNTYLHAGLPPGPIANPSVASIVAALNPKNTSCLYYFHDSKKQFHCSETYAEHVTLLKKYYGRGK